MIVRREGERKKQDLLVDKRKVKRAGIIKKKKSRCF